ncbi:MAG: hypothetical protein M1333_00715 [Patescibacteria group bacterium]|nr:hypothetical protein [Patescibacteria group bacterium]
MGRQNIACYVLVQCLAPRDDEGRFWVYEMARVPEVGERVEGEELSNPDTSWKVQLVISDPKIVAMLAALDAIDSVADMGDGFVDSVNRLLIAIVEGKQVI